MTDNDVAMNTDLQQFVNGIIQMMAISFAEDQSVYQVAEVTVKGTAKKMAVMVATGAQAEMVEAMLVARQKAQATQATSAIEVTDGKTLVETVKEAEAQAQIDALEKFEGPQN